MLSAVDSAVMLVDAAKGLEAQTLKLFEVAGSGASVITVINKWDRPGNDALELMDLIQRRAPAFSPTPLTWPVGMAGDFRGVLDARTGEFLKYTRTAGGATVAPEEQLDRRRGHRARGRRLRAGRRRRTSCSPSTRPTTTVSASWPARPRR